MAKYYFTYACGHPGEIQLYGPGKQREWRLEQEEAKLCPDCYQASLDEENAKAAAANRAIGLPELSGTEKQIAWAESIRGEFCARAEDVISKLDPQKADLGKARGALDYFYRQAKASWWIDNRLALRPLETAYHLNDIFNSFARAIIAARQEAEPAAVSAKAEATVRPKEPVTETVAEIKVLPDGASINFPERREGFREIVRKLGFRWSDYRWFKAGNPIERAAEVGHHLLAAGFIVCIQDETARAKAIAGDYEPEKTRWIYSCEGKFALQWGRDEDFYEVARRLPGSRYEKPFVTVPAEQYDQVLDFANRYDFSLDDFAKRMVEQAKLNKEAALVAKVTPPREPVPTTPDAVPPKLEVPEEVEIDEALRDDD